jgi:plasmid stabilization system protein ParE
MPRPGWSAKRERQYEHILESLKARGASEEKAEEIAARTVNKLRARAGETRKVHSRANDSGEVEGGA